ncbi:hypothetical protein CM19_06885 [Candidatus Acidianus copahuensis]|uniref:PEGA domain-containing protein n=2 Tax=Candidatus Acidianus copahuensis TaxID=1160895 RepID=A0A031LQ28_9CREN|nr:hypothetical protein CM19_06885 [Candidatus Acidianus copahuensis]
MLLFLSLIPLSSMAGLIPVQHAEYGVFQGTIFLNNDSFVASNYEGFNPGLGTDRLAFNPLNNYIYVTNSFNNSVYVINGTKIVGRLNIPRFPTDIVFNPINGYIYVADAGSNEVTVIKNMTIIANVKVGDSPHGLAVTSSGYVYVADSISRQITVIDNTSVIREIYLNFSPYEIVYDPSNGDLFVTSTNFNGVYIIHNGSISEIHGNSQPYSISYDEKNGEVYIDGLFKGFISAISSKDVIIENISFPYPSYGLAFSSNGYIYATSINGSVFVINNLILKNFHVGKYPKGIVLANDKVYVANYDSSTVSVINLNLSFFHFLMIKAIPDNITFSVEYNGEIFSSINGELSFISTPGNYYLIIENTSLYYTTNTSLEISLGNSNRTVYIYYLKYAFIEGHVNPYNSLIFLNGKKVATTGTFLLELPAGRYNIRIESPGYQNYSINVTLSNGQIYILNTTLKILNTTYLNPEYHITLVDKPSSHKNFIEIWLIILGTSIGIILFLTRNKI